MKEDIELSELKARISNGDEVNMIDVREAWEFEEINIGARLISLTSLPNHLDQISENKTDEVIVHCMTGSRSRKAKIYLTSQGFSNVRSLIGGLEAYLEN